MSERGIRVGSDSLDGRRRRRRRLFSRDIYLA